jgi:mxaD protein
MGTARAETTIATTADKVWAVIGDFGYLTWMPGIDACRVEGDLRVLSVQGIEITERLVHRDEAARSLTYNLIGGPLQIDHHEATITVTPQGDDSIVTWDVDTDEAMAGPMGKQYQGALDALKAQLEA